MCDSLLVKTLAPVLDTKSSWRIRMIDWLHTNSYVSTCMYQFAASATRLVLCIRGILGKGTLRTYPFSRVPTTTYELVLWIRMSAQHIIQTRIIFVCWPHTNSYIMAAKYYKFVCLPHTNSYMAMKYYKFVCFQRSEFNTTNSYMTNQNKLAI